MRLKAFQIIVFVSFCILGMTLVYIQIIRGEYYYGLSKNNHIRIVSLGGKRGQILDRNGLVIADNRISFDVAMIPQEVQHQERLFVYLSTALNIDTDVLRKTFEQKRSAPFIPVVLVEDITKDQAFVLEENKFLFPGLEIQTITRRHYPFGHINVHVLGYVGKISRSKITQLKDYGYSIQSIVGYSGVEEYYDNFLQGEDGGIQVEVNNRGEQVRLLGFREPKSGQSLTLTIDHRIQKIAAGLLENKKGTIVVMDLDTDEILGMVSSPSFDPNDFVEGDPSISAIFSDPHKPLLNRAISGQYPPGSTFKVSLAIGALETGKISPETSFNCPGYYQLGKRRFHCLHSHGVQNLNEGIFHSCNVYFFNTGLKTGPDVMAQYARMFQLGGLTGIDLPYEAKGFIPDRAQRRALRNQGWYDGDTLNMSIGQGEVLVTPLQLLSMMTMVAKNGTKTYPFVLKSIGTEPVKRRLPSRSEVGISTKTLEIVQRGLRAAVSDHSGTARLLNIENLVVLGKTGTAQTSGGREPHAWFVGYCPNAKTRIVFCVFLEFGGSSYYACQVAKDLLRALMKEKIL